MGKDNGKQISENFVGFEGRNGYLSQLNFCRRGLGKKKLPVLTVLHNFELKRQDGTTAAQRFFGTEFPDLFESILPSINKLPRPRKSGLNKTLTVKAAGAKAAGPKAAGPKAAGPKAAGPKAAGAKAPGPKAAGA